MKRLYWQVYLTFLGILLLFGLLLAVVFSTTSTDDGRGLDALARVAEELLPGPDASSIEMTSALERIHEELDVSATVWGRSGERIAAAGDELPRPASAWRESRFVHSRGAGFTVALAFSDGRWAVVRYHRRTPGPARWLMVFALLGVAVAAGAYPLVRRLTGRIERLGRRVDALAAGELGARVEVEGRDEVATLAEGFNRAAERIERLVVAQRTLLEGVSHELRSPLTRIRMAVELLGAEVRPELRERISMDISELDALLGELLLASRLETLDTIGAPADVDLLALVAEEASSFDAEVSATEVTIPGDARLLRRLIRNLLSNARRYGGESRIEIDVRASPTGGALLSVADNGPGIPENERERIFEPFFRGADARATNEEGVGLGLALVQRIARLHGGRVRCVPGTHGGARFEVELGLGDRD
jgi:signal transduction histidine kinase